ncbi:MAG: permease-like cell division protein FtsX [bacterium]|nr:permease-like cell division protein FtsX [bacterium]
MTDLLTSIRRTPYQSLAAFLILFFTLFLSTTILISMSFLHGILGYVETRPQVTAYFQQKISQSDIFKIKDDLTNSDKVESVKYISKDEAFKIYSQLNKDNPLLLEMVSSDILPASLEIYAKKPSYLPEIAAFLQKQPGVDEVHFQKNIVDRLLILTSILRRTTLLFFVFLILMSTVVLTTTTLFKVAMKKEEIELLKLLGASNWYIRKPFVQEAIFFGFLAAITSFAIIVTALLYSEPFLSSYLRGISTLSIAYNSYQIIVWPLNPLFLGICFSLSAVFGMGLAFWGSYIATGKYLK